MIVIITVILCVIVIGVVIHLEEMTGVPVTNLTVESGGSNSEILRRIVEYTWRNEVGRTGFIVQWTEMDRLEYCDGDSEWYQSRQSSQLDGTHLPQEVLLKIKKIQESQAYTHSVSSHFWLFIQQVLSLHSVMQQTQSRYFQVHCSGTDLHDFLHGSSRNYFSAFKKKLTKTLNSTNWLYNTITRADLNSHGYSVIGKGDPHFDSAGHRAVARNFHTHMVQERWRQGAATQ